MSTNRRFNPYENSGNVGNESSGLRSVFESMNLNEHEYSFDIDDGTITLHLENKGNMCAHLDIIQNVVSYLYAQQLKDERIHEHSNHVGQFTVSPVNDPNIPTMHFSMGKFSCKANENESDSDSDFEEDSNAYSESIFSEEEEEEKFDYFANCKLINKYIGAPKKIKANDPLLTNKESCFICFEEYKSGEYKRVLPQCGHVFHKKCIDKWLKQKSTCPHCRCDLMKDVKITLDDLKYYQKDECMCHVGNQLIEIEFGFISYENHPQNQNQNQNQKEEDESE